MHQTLQSKRTALKQRGFSLIELAIVVTIIGILAALALPYFKRATQNAQIARLENDLRHYEQTFDSYELEFGTFPVSQPISGMYPIEMEERLSHRWKENSPIGGEYRWVYDPDSDVDFAYIEIENTANAPILLSPGRLLDIDKDIDDGNISTGKVRLLGLNLRLFVRQ